MLLQSHLPFAVVGSNDEVKIGNKMVKARQYPWGTVQGKSSVIKTVLDTFWNVLDAVIRLQQYCMLSFKNIGCHQKKVRNPVYP
jgi:hypothetical protein